MKTIRNKGYGYGGIALVLLLFLVVSVFNHFSSSADGGVEPKDITHLVNYKLNNLSVRDGSKYHFVVKDGEKLADAPKIYKGNGIRLDYIWNIEDPREIVAGDFFLIPLPDAEVIKVPNFVADIKIRKPDGSGEDLKIGKLSIVEIEQKKYLKGTFGDNFSNKLKLENGVLFVYAEVKYVKKDMVLEFGDPKTSTTTVTIVTEYNPGNNIQPGEPEAPHYPENFKEADKREPLYKWGAYMAQFNGNSYTISMNWDQMVKIYKANITNKELEQSGQPTHTEDTYVIKEKNEYVLIDELPGNLFVKPETIRIGSHLNAPAYDKSGVITKDGFSPTVVLSAYATAPIGDGPIKKIKIKKNGILTDFVEIDATGDALQWKAFRDQIIAKTTPTLGIWKNKKLVLNLGTIPSKDFKFEDYYGGKDGENGLFASIDKRTVKKSRDRNAISLEQAEMMKKAYADQNILNYFLSFATYVDGPTAKEYTNIATISYKEKSKKQFTVTNKVETIDLSGSIEQKPFEGEIKVIKKWYGEEKDTADIKVSGSNGNNEHRHQLTKGNWNHTFKGLPITDASGQPITYTISEENIPADYRVEVLENKNEFIYTILNIQQISITANKVWKDVNDSLLSNPNEEVTIQLYRRHNWGDEKVAGKSHTFPAGTTDWSYTFTGLDKADENGDIVYVIKEDTPPTGFTMVQEGNAENGYQVINKKNVEQIQIPVKKEWKDASGHALSDNNLTVTVHLEERVGTGSFTKVDGTEKVLDSSNHWAYTYTVPKYKVSGSLIETIEYKAVETAVPGFALTQEGTEANAYTLVNTKDIDQIKIVAKKEWKNEADADLKDSSLVANISLHERTGSGEFSKVADSEVTLNSGNKWSHTYTVPKFKKEGSKLVKIEYKVIEDKVPGFTLIQEGTEAHSYTLINKKEIGTITIPAKKEWKNEAGEPLVDNTLVAKISLHEKVGSGEFTKVAGSDIVLNSGNGWVHSYIVPSHKVVGFGLEPIVYKIEEEKISGFTLIQEGTAANAYTLINKKEIGMITIPAKKEWKNEAGEPLVDNTLVAKISLYEKVGSAEFTKVSGTDITLDSGNAWKHTYTVPSHKVIGTSVEEIVYKVEEERVSGFTLIQEGTVATAYTLINKKDVETIQIPVKKEWKNETGQPLSNASLSVNVSLYEQVGTEAFTKVAGTEISLNAGNSWTYTYTVPKYKVVGTKIEPITYKAMESSLPGFTQIQEGTAATSYTLVNRKDPVPYIVIPYPVPDIPDKKPEPKKPETPDKPKDENPTPPVKPVPVPPTEEKIPPVVPNEDDEDIDIEENETPLGDTEVEKDKTPKGKTKVKKDKKILAKTGGLKNYFVSVLAVLGLSLLALWFVERDRKKLKDR